MALPVVPNLNLGWKALLVIFGFFAFVTVLVTTGVFAATSSMSMMVGLFLVAIAVAGAFMGKLTFSSPVFLGMIIIGGLLAVVNPSKDLTVAQFFPNLKLLVGMVL